MAKTTKKPYSKKSHTVIPSAGHTIVSDLRMMRGYSNSGSRYVATFVDRKSRLVRVYYLKRKSELTATAKNFIEWVKTQRGSPPKNLHADGGGEYTSRELGQFCEELGINLEHTAADSPEQNGIAERINRTLVEGTTALLHQAGLQYEFWEEAMNYFVFVKNRTPHSALGGKTPIDEWNEGLGEVDSKGLWGIKTFGCRADVHIPERMRTGGKDGVKVRLGCVYLGPAPKRKTDMFFDPSRDKIIFGYANYFEQDNFPLNVEGSQTTSSSSTSSSSSSSSVGGSIAMGSSVSMGSAAGVSSFSANISGSSSSSSDSSNTSSNNNHASNNTNLNLIDPSNTNLNLNDPSNLSAARNNTNLNLNEPSNTNLNLNDPSTLSAARGEEERGGQDMMPPLEVVKQMSVQRGAIQPQRSRVGSVEGDEVESGEAEEESKSSEEEYEIKRILKQRKSRFGPMGDKHKGVDYFVEWGGEYNGESEWVRDIDVTTSEIIEEWESRNQVGEKVVIGAEAERENDTAEEEVQVLLASMAESEKLTRSKVLKRGDCQKFMEGERDELEAGFATNCLEKVKEGVSLAGHKIYNMMWVYKIKPKTLLEDERYRSRLCVLGNKQGKESYSETFAAVAKVKTFRLLLTLCVFYGMKMTQLDVSNAFMYADLDREMYVYPPPGHEHLGILKLNKSLYGLKQAPRLWYDTMAEVLTSPELGFEQTMSDVCCFSHPTERCYILMYVDDICVVTNNERLRERVLQTLRNKFKLKHFDEAKLYVGLQMEWSDEGRRVKVHQQSYIEKLLKIFGMVNCNPKDQPCTDSDKLSSKDPVSSKMATRPYRSLVGALLYVLGSRPDVAASIRAVSQFMSIAADKHWDSAKRILSYLSGTRNKGVVYTQQETYNLTAYSDSDYANDEDRKSVTGYVIYAQGGPVVWKSKKQPTVAKSVCEAEYVALSDAIAELLWLKMTLDELKVEQDRPMRLYIDNQAAKNLAENAVSQDRTKHIDIKYHFIRQVVQSGRVQLYYVGTKENVSDLLTKSTSRAVFRKLVGHLVTN
jgi:hypothetical protein